MYTKLAAVPWYGLVALAGIAAAQPPLAYHSAYADYRPYVEESPAPWRELNDEAARVGGHAGIFGGGMHHGPAAPATRETSGAKAAPATPAAKPAPAHGHH